MLSIMLMSVLNVKEISYVSVIGYGVLVCREALTGFILGYAASICNSIVLFAGNIIDMDIGLSMATEFDPTMNTQVTITGNIYYYFTLLLMLIGNVHQFLLRSLVDSFSLIPLGGAVLDRDHLLASMIYFMRNLFILGFRIMLPIFATILVMNVVLGIMAKVAPQMNMFSVGVQIKILAGLAVLYLCVFLFPEVVALLTEQIKVNMRNFAGGLH